MIDFGIVIVAIHLSSSKLKYTKSALSFHQRIVIDLGGIAGKHSGSFIEREVIVFSVDDTYSADSEDERSLSFQSSRQDCNTAWQ